MKLSSCDNVDRYLQFLTFPKFDNTSFQIHCYFLRRYDIRFEKNVNLEIVYKMHFHRETNCFYYAIDNIVDIYDHHGILIRVDDFISHASYRYKKGHLSDFQFRNIFHEIRTIIKCHFTSRIRKNITFFRIKIR